MSAKERTANGLKLLLNKENDAFAQVQGAWRFLNNDNVSTEDLFNPIWGSLTQDIKKQTDKYILMMTDWSHIDYKKHKSKKELIVENRKDNKVKKGLDLQTTIAVSDRTGDPIGVVAHNLRTAEKFHSTYDNDIKLGTTHLEELGSRAKWIKENLETEKKRVHIVDREADSVAFMRELVEIDELFLLRAKSNSTVYYPKEEIDIKQGELAKKLPLGKKIRKIKYKNKEVTIYVNEVGIEIRRDATKFIVKEDGKKKLQRKKGQTIKARFIVERLVDKNNEVVAEWMLISNILDETVTKEMLGDWYYYRWKIESYFKLLKSSGFNLEEWQQKDPKALFRRLLIVSYASVLVWKIANENSINAVKARKFLVQLSGRAIERHKDFTLPSLLKGLENYIQMLDVIELFTKDELMEMKKDLVSIMGMDISV